MKIHDELKTCKKLIELNETEKRSILIISLDYIIFITDDDSFLVLSNLLNANQCHYLINYKKKIRILLVVKMTFLIIWFLNDLLTIIFKIMI